MREGDKQKRILCNGGAPLRVLSQSIRDRVKPQFPRHCVHVYAMCTQYIFTLGLISDTVVIYNFSIVSFGLFASICSVCNFLPLKKFDLDACISVVAFLVLIDV